MARTGKTLFQNCEAYTVQQYADRTGWLRGRSGGIGGSDAAAAIGRSPWRTNYELWLIKTGRKQAEDISNSELVRYGTKAEDPLRKLYALDHPYFEIQHQSRPAARSRIVEQIRLNRGPFHLRARQFRDGAPVVAEILGLNAQTAQRLSRETTIPQYPCVYM